MTTEELKYPIGKFEKPDEITKDILSKWISEISTFPARLISETSRLTDAHLNTKYRSGGWTIRQVVHHCADSHMNALIRLKLALTEDSPMVKPYDEGRWAELSDTKILQIEPSLKMIDGIHARWTDLLNSLTNEQFKRIFMHPEHGKKFSIEENTGLYAWHGNHHLAHIQGAISRNNIK